MRRCSLALFALLLTSKSVFAGNTGVLIKDVPHARNKPAVIAAVRQAFVGRRWSIETSDADSVTASLEDDGTSARMRIYLQGTDLIYEEETTRDMAASRAPAAAFSSQPRPIKLRSWLRNIRADVAALLAGIPDVPNTVQPNAPARDFSERLKILESLRADGSITEDEYKAKRAEILRDL